MNTDDFIFIDGEAWIPVEITLMTDGFMEAWETGARQWRDAESKGVANFYPVQGAWETYAPVSISGSALPLLFPDIELILASYKDNMDSFIEGEVAQKADAYFDRIRRRGDSAQLRNRIGVLYARYGMYEDAEEQFLIATDRDRTYVAPMINLGNVSFLRKDMDSALSWYEKAAGMAPDNEVVLAGLARTRYELEQFDQARADYERLAEIAPETAARYTYLGQASETYARASAARDKGRTLWDDEEDLE